MAHCVSYHLGWLNILADQVKLKTLEFKISLLRARITAAARDKSEASFTKAQRHVDGLAELSNVVRNLQAREWTESEILRTKYSEELLLELRRRTLQEQVTGRTLQAEAHASLLEEAQAELARLESAA
jgi:hypothetical protein